MNTKMKNSTLKSTSGDVDKKSQNIQEIYEDNDVYHQKEQNTPLFIFLLGLGFNMTLHFLMTCGVRVINIIVTGTEAPDSESRKWTAICTSIGIIVSLVSSKPFGVLTDIYGRRMIFLLCLFFWFLRFLISFLAFYLMQLKLLIFASFFQGIGLPCFWLPKVILNDILPKDKVSIWYTYTFVASGVCHAVISMGIGLLTNQDYGNVDLIYIVACPVVISFIVLITAFLYLIESNPKLDTNYSWKDFVFIFDAKIIMKLDNVGILFIVLFTTFWARSTSVFDLDNFMNTHFHWSILKVCIMTTVGAVVTLILHPWGLTVNRFSDTSVVKGAMICKIIANILIALTPLTSEYVVFIAVFFEASGGVGESILKSLLASHGDTSKLFGALQALRSLSGLLVSLFLLFYRFEMQKPSQVSIKPSLHFIVAAVFVIIGTLVFWRYPQTIVSNEHNSTSIISMEGFCKESEENIEKKEKEKETKV